MWMIWRTLRMNSRASLGPPNSRHKQNEETYHSLLSLDQSWTNYRWTGSWTKRFTFILGNNKKNCRIFFWRDLKPQNWGAVRVPCKPWARVPHESRATGQRNWRHSPHSQPEGKGKISGVAGANLGHSNKETSDIRLLKTCFACTLPGCDEPCMFLPWAVYNRRFYLRCVTTFTWSMPSNTVGAWGGGVVVGWGWTCAHGSMLCASLSIIPSLNSHLRWIWREATNTRSFLLLLSRIQIHSHSCQKIPTCIFNIGLWFMLLAAGLCCSGHFLGRDAVARCPTSLPGALLLLDICVYIF